MKFGVRGKLFLYTALVIVVAVLGSGAYLSERLREDDTLLQRDWTNVRCRPTPGRLDEDDKWETKWRVASRSLRSQNTGISFRNL